jgi:hypothetical protein
VPSWQTADKRCIDYASACYQLQHCSNPQPAAMKLVILSKLSMFSILDICRENHTHRFRLHAGNTRVKQGEAEAFSAMVAGAPSRHVSTAFCCMIFAVW